jgi:hypothetical protein
MAVLDRSCLMVSRVQQTFSRILNRLTSGKIRERLQHCATRASALRRMQQEKPGKAPSGLGVIDFGLIKPGMVRNADNDKTPGREPRELRFAFRAFSLDGYRALNYGECVSRGTFSSIHTDTVVV